MQLRKTYAYGTASLNLSQQQHTHSQQQCLSEAAEEVVVISEVVREEEEVEVSEVREKSSRRTRIQD